MEQKEGWIVSDGALSKLLGNVLDCLPELFQFRAGPEDVENSSPVHLAPPATIRG